MDLNAADLEAAFAARHALATFKDDSDFEDSSIDDENENSDDEDEGLHTNRGMTHNDGTLRSNLVEDDDDDGEWEDEDDGSDDEETTRDDHLRGVGRDDLDSLSNMVRQLEMFMSGQSGLDGVELPE